GPSLASTDPVVGGPAGIDRKCRKPHASDDGKDSPGLKEPHHLVRLLQARQESNLQPPVLERTPSNAGVAAFVDFQGLSAERTTPASLDDAGVGTNPGTEKESSPAYSPATRTSVSTTAMFGNSAWGTPCRSCRYAGLL